jgi:GAF domain-containing protein
MAAARTGEVGSMSTFPDDVTEAFHDIAGALFSATDADSSLQRIVDLAPKTFDGCTWAGAAVISEGQVSTAAASHDVVKQLDALEDVHGTGPVLTALMHSSTVQVDDVSEHGDWPEFCASAQELGVRSLLAHRILTSGDTIGALVLYGDRVDAFGGADPEALTIFAAYSGMALGCSEVSRRDSRQLVELERALASRDTIGQAKGILMERLRFTPDQAFERLRLASMDQNVKVRDLAETVVRTGEVPVLRAEDQG